MNKCRRMITELALRLADRGVATLVPDLYGTGDSGGDFAEAGWAGWRGDLGVACRWSAAQGCPVTALLAIRLGCALAIDASASSEIPAVQRTVLWQPQFDGSRFLSQFLRLRVAASLMEDRKETLGDLRARLQAGAATEVAGYTLSSRLAAELEQVRPPESLPESFGGTAWLEVVREIGSGLPAPSEKLVEATRRQGTRIYVSGLQGEPYWSATEIVVNSDVVDATVEFLDHGLGQAMGPAHD